MLKKLMSLLCSLFVPKRAVNGGRGSKLIYGAEATEFGLPDWDNPVVIPLPDGDAKEQAYVTTSACLVVLYVNDGFLSSKNTTYSLLEVKKTFISLVRSYQHNNAVNCFLKKGDTVTFQWSGSGVEAKVYPLVLPN